MKTGSFMLKYLILIAIACSNAHSGEIKLISYNIETNLFKSNKKALEKVSEVIEYYSPTINIFHNSFNPKSDKLKTNGFHPYFSYSDMVRKRTSTIITSEHPIINENHKPLKHRLSLWKTYGITHVTLKTGDKEIQLFCLVMPKSKRKVWNNVLILEKYIKRHAYKGEYLLSIEFDDRPKGDVISYLKKRLDLTDLVEQFAEENNLDLNKFKTGIVRRKPARTNILFSSKNSIQILNIYPIFDGTHDENRYLKDAALYYHISL